LLVAYLFSRMERPESITLGVIPIGSLTICYRQMHLVHGAMALFGVDAGFSGNGHHNGLTLINIMVKELVPIVLSCAV